MFGKTTGACTQGIEGRLIEVETDISPGLPQINIVGLPDSAVREATERVRAAIRNCGFAFPLERITINLAPADWRKEGSSLDLAIAAGILAVSGQIRLPEKPVLFIGELALDGSLRPVPGVLSMADEARRRGIRTVAVPAANAREAALIQGIGVCPVTHLREIADPKLFHEVNYLQHKLLDRPHPPNETARQAGYQEDYADVLGQSFAKRALMLAAAGMHNILLVGPPGTGKSMLARRLPTILPPLDDEEALEVTKIYSVTGMLTSRAELIRSRPFRAPHHTVTAAGLVGGGSIPKPGEISLAHKGVLFLDELPEFARPSLEVLRQPLEERKVTIGRAKAVYSYPAHFMLVASMNPCPCGYLGSDTPGRSCSCTEAKVNQYRSRISGPLLDRIDMHVEVPRQNLSSQPAPGETSESMRKRVVQARRLQQERYRGAGIAYNSELQGRVLRRYCPLPPEAERLLSLTFESLGLSMRAHDRIVKLARTIADLEQSDEIRTEHIAEAIQYRALDRTFPYKN